MAAAITTVSSTLEGQAIEILEALSDKQASAASNPNGNTVVTAYNRNMQNKQITASLSLASDDSTDTSGHTVISAVELFV